MLERSRFRPPRSVVIRIDKASPTSGATLFQPIGHLLVEAMKAGVVQRCHPLPDAGAGFWVSLTGNPNAPEETGEEEAAREANSDNPDPGPPHDHD